MNSVSEGAYDADVRSPEYSSDMNCAHRERGGRKADREDVTFSGIGTMH